MTYIIRFYVEALFSESFGVVCRDSVTNLTRYAREKLDFCHCARQNVNVGGSVRFFGIVHGRAGNNIKKRNFDAGVDGIYDSPFVAGGADAFMHFRESDFLPRGPFETKLIGRGFRGVKTFFPPVRLRFPRCFSTSGVAKWLSDASPFQGEPTATVHTPSTLFGYRVSVPTTTTILSGRLYLPPAIFSSLCPSALHAGSRDIFDHGTCL